MAPAGARALNPAVRRDPRRPGHRHRHRGAGSSARRRASGWHERPESRWNDDEAAAWGDDLGLLTYASRLLGGDPSLVLHGGGNSSVKVTERDVFGDPVEVLHVKGSGWDMATIERAGFAPLRLDRVARLADLDALSDARMANELQGRLARRRRRPRRSSRSCTPRCRTRSCSTPTPTPCWR